MSAPAVPARLGILLVGVGGQGVLTAARAIGEAAHGAGLEVRVGQVHGMSRRGGSVEGTVGIGPGESGFLGARTADVVVGFEPLETRRALPRMSRGTRVLCSTGPVVPFGLTLGGGEYPPVERILEEVRRAAAEVREVDGPRVAREAGLPRALNVVMLGALAALGALPFGEDALWRAVEARCPPRWLEANRRAFLRGGEAAAVAGEGRAAR